jgi:prepilin-type N-terminal cleavage/methylation domain-containing protein
VTDARRDGCAARAAGFSLIELLVVLVVISVGLLALSGVQTNAQRDSDATGRHARAMFVAKTQMEIARAAGYDSTRSDSGLAGRFNWNTRVDSAAYGLKRVTVQVTYAEDGRGRTIRLMDLVAKR